MKRFKSIILAGFAVVFVATLALPAVQASALSSSSLSITPKKNYVIEPGKSVSDKLTIRNLDTASPLQLSLRVVDFTFTDDGGTPKLMLANDAPQTTWSLKPFLTVPQNVTIPPSSSKTLNIDVAIPANHGAGSYYSAIVYSSGAPGDGGNVGLSASGVTLVFTSIPGTVNENLKLQKFGAYMPASADKPASYKYITTDKPNLIGYTLQNNGNVTEAPVGSITLKNIFGQTQTIDNVNPNGSLALIGQTRTYTTCIKLQDKDVSFNGTTTKSTSCVAPSLWPGRYKVSLDLFYGQNGNRTQEIVSTAVFWYLPIWFLMVLIVVLSAAAYGIWRLVRVVRRKLYGPQFSKSARRRK